MAPTRSNEKAVPNKNDKNKDTTANTMLTRWLMTPMPSTTRVPLHTTDTTSITTSIDDRKLAAKPTRNAAGPSNQRRAVVTPTNPPPLGIAPTRKNPNDADQQPRTISPHANDTSSTAGPPQKRRRKGKTGSTLKTELAMETDPVSTMTRKTNELFMVAKKVAPRELLRKITTVIQRLTAFVEAINTIVSRQGFDIDLEEIIGNDEGVYLLRYTQDRKKLGQARHLRKRVFEIQNQTQETAQRVTTLAQAQALLRQVNAILQYDIVETIFALQLPRYGYYKNEHDEQIRTEIALLLVEGGLACCFQCVTNTIFEDFLWVPDLEIQETLNPKTKQAGLDHIQGVKKYAILQTWPTVDSYLRDPTQHTEQQYAFCQRLLREEREGGYVTKLLSIWAFDEENIVARVDAVKACPRIDDLNPIIENLRTILQQAELEDPPQSSTIKEQLTRELAKIEKGSLKADGTSNYGPYQHPSQETLGTGAWEVLPQFLTGDKETAIVVEKSNWVALETIDSTRFQRTFPNPPEPLVSVVVPKWTALDNANKIYNYDGFDNRRDGDLEGQEEILVSVTDAANGQPVVIIPSFFVALDEMSSYKARAKALAALYALRLVLEQLNLVRPGLAQQIHRLAQTFLMKIKGLHGKCDGSMRAARYTFSPKGYYSGNRPGILSVTKYIGKGVHYLDSIYICSRLSEDLFARMLRLFDFPNNGITVFHSKHKGCEGVPAIGDACVAIECPNASSDAVMEMTIIAPDDPNHPFSKRIACRSCCRNFYKAKRIAAALESHEKLNPEQTKMLEVAKTAIADETKLDSVRHKESRAVAMATDAQQVLETEKAKSDKSRNNKQALSITDDSAREEEQAKNQETYQKQKNKGQTTKRPEKIKNARHQASKTDRYFPELYAVQKIVVDVLLNHTNRNMKVKVDGVDLLVPFLQITEILEMMYPIWTRAGELHPKKHLTIGGWPLFFSEVDTERTKPHYNVHDFRRILNNSGLKKEGQQKWILEVTHYTNYSSRSKESFDEANALRANLKEKGFLDSLREKVYVRYRAEKAIHPEWNNVQILP